MSNDLMSSILSQLSADVKNNVDELMNNKININIPTFLDDLEIQNLPIEFAEKTKVVEELTDLGKLNKAYNRLLTKGNENTLTDSFRSQTTKEIKSRTEESLTTTLASFGRYMSILQATA